MAAVNSLIFHQEFEHIFHMDIILIILIPSSSTF